MSNNSILTVAELIDSAFGEPEGNVVHHKHLQTVLYLLARQLRVLERRVAVQINPNIRRRSSSSLSVTELKLHTMDKKKTEPGKERTERLQGEETTLSSKSRTESTKDKALTDKPLSDQKSITSDKTTTAKATHMTLTEKEFSDKTSTHRSTTAKELGEKGLTDKTSFGKNLPDKSLTGKSSTDQISIAETSTDKTSTDITSTEKTSTDKTSTDKTSTDKRSTDKDSTEKTSTVKISNKKTTTDKTLTEKTSTDKTSIEQALTDKISTEKTSTDETPTGKPSTDKTFAKPSTDEISSDKPSSDKKQTEKSPMDKKSTEKGSTDKKSTEKFSAEKPSRDKKATEKSLSDKKSTEISSTVKSSTGHTKTGKSFTTAGRSTMGSQDYHKLLDQLEEMRERELRVIHQRANSREEGNRTPTPIGSLDSFEAKYEKLLIVERVPAEEAEARAARGGLGTRRSDAGPRISVVTQEQFDTLANAVREIQRKFGPIGTAELPENAQLMNELRKGASLTEAMAALQLSARLEATEKTINNMLAIITELASQTSPVQLEHVDDDIEVIFGSDNKKKKTTESSKHHQKSPPPKPKVGKIEVPLGGSPSEASVALSVLQTDKDMSKIEGPAEKPREDRVTYGEFEAALQGVQNNMMKFVTDITNRCSTNADNAIKLAIKLEGKIDASLNLGNRMADLENVVSNYAEQVNVLDTGMSSQLTNYQEELTQMQHDLEIGLETMAEVLANTGGDATAVAELNSHFSDLQQDIDNTLTRQKELRDIQYLLSVDLNALRREIEILRDAKSDREEVVDALRDKAGLGALNGLISHQQFDAIQGDFEKRIAAAHDKFNSQEIVWQKAIDDLLRELNEKADLTQVEGLRDDINRYLEQFRVQIKFMKDIVGEPCASALSKKINTGTACLSCGNPAHLNEDEGGVPMLPALRPPAIGAEAPKPKEDGDHGLCYPGYPLPHPRDPRSHVCHRWCGGSHTLLPNAAKRVPPDMIITQANRNATTQMGTDGNMYAVDDPVPMEPCSYCNKSKSIPEPSINKLKDDHSDMVPYDYCATLNTGRVNETISVTPPNFGTD